MAEPVTPDDRLVEQEASLPCPCCHDPDCDFDCDGPYDEQGEGNPTMIHNNPDSDAIERVEKWLNAMRDIVLDPICPGLTIADLRTLFALAKPTPVMGGAAQRTPYCPGCGGSCLDVWHSAAMGDDAELVERLNAREYRNDGESDDWPELVNPDGPEAASRLQQLSAEVVRLTAEMVRRDENENRHCLNYGPCSRMDQHQGDV